MLKFNKMKILFILLLYGSCLFGQSKSTIYTLNIDASDISGTDSVYQPEYKPQNKIDISGMFYTITVTATGLDAQDGTITFGGSNNLIDSSTRRYAFESFTHDSLPYTLDTTKMIKITNGVSTNQKSFERTGSKYGFPFPMVQLVLNSLTSGNITVIFRFFE